MAPCPIIRPMKILTLRHNWFWSEILQEDFDHSPCSPQSRRDSGRTRDRARVADIICIYRLVMKSSSTPVKKKNPQEKETEMGKTPKNRPCNKISDEKNRQSQHCSSVCHSSINTILRAKYFAQLAGYIFLIKKKAVNVSIGFVVCNKCVHRQNIWQWFV